ncbi:hypothetical protein MKX01_013772, partial [Papaver californicum]
MVIIRKSEKKPKVQGSFVVMACENFGEFKRVNRTCIGQNAVARRQRKNPRKTGSKKYNCPFRLRITWPTQSLPYETLIGHSFLGRLNPEEIFLCICL